MKMPFMRWAILCAIITFSFLSSATEPLFSVDIGQISNAPGIVERDVAFTNPESHAITITRVETSCGCVNAMIDQWHIEPAEAITLHIELKSAGMEANSTISQYVYLHTDDPDSPLYIIQVTGMTMPSSVPLKAYPANLNVSPLIPEQKIKRIVTVHRMGMDTLGEITASVSVPWITLKRRELVSDVNNTIEQYDVEIDASAINRKAEANITFQLDGNANSLYVHVTVIKPNPIIVSPSIVRVQTNDEYVDIGISRRDGSLLKLANWNFQGNGLNVIECSQNDDLFGHILVRVLNTNKEHMFGNGELVMYFFEEEEPVTIRFVKSPNM